MLWIYTCIACIIVVLFYQGLVEKQLFIADEQHVTLNKYISTIPPAGSERFVGGASFFSG